MAERKKPPETTAFAGEASTEGLSEQSHPDRIARLGALKKRAVSMAAWLDAKPDDLLAERCQVRMRGCANYLIFNHYYTVGQIRLAGVMTCQIHLLCPFCARARAMKALGAYLERFEVLKAANPRLKLALLTLTVKNGPDLEERFTHLVESWKTYCKRRRQSLSVKRGYNELSKVDGALFSYELTKSPEHGWHPHLHAVVILNEWIDREKLAEQWEGITVDSKIVDIRRIKGNPVEGFAEVCKYALKFADLDEADTYHAYQALKGRRLQGSFGCFRGVVVPEGAVDDLLELPFLELRYQYRNGAGYSLSENPRHRR